MFFKDADSLFAWTVKDCYQNGRVVKSYKDKSHEKLGDLTVLENPLARVVTNPVRPLNIVTALARFTWLVAGNNRLEDIAFYEPKVKGYTDNGLTVPGSSYGARLAGTGRPGLHQIEAAIDRLKLSPATRQAAAVVWTPEDATCKYTNDVPCEFGMFFHVRLGRLIMINIMRSNNAFRLLPFNIFEFTMLGELVASELGVNFGEYQHFVSNMHILNANPKEWQATLSLVDQEHSKSRSFTMPPMPIQSWGDARTLAQFEAELRHCNSVQEVFGICTKAEERFLPYWKRLFSILAAYKLIRLGYDRWSNLLGDGTVLSEYALVSLRAMEQQWQQRIAESAGQQAGKSPMGGKLANEAFIDAVTRQPGASPYNNIDED